MIRELLTQRLHDYEETTKMIIGLYGQKLIKALRFYTKTDRNININSVDFCPLNHNFVLSTFSTDLIIGDKIKLPDNTVVEIDDTNLNRYTSDQMKLILSINALENLDAFQLHELLKRIDKFIKQYGANSYQNGLESGIIDFDDLLTNPSYIKILDSVTDPLNSIIENMDDLQKFQFYIFSKASIINKVLH
jgi:hypothetical protein